MISIVVPVYNTAKYLNQCLESIHNQTYSDWECVLVDDGSKDDSGSICDAWAEKDSRFRVIHKENQGVSAARNDGIKEAKGDYIAFIDSDDWVEREYLEELSRGIGSDYVVAGLVMDYQDREPVIHKPSRSRFLKFDSTVDIDDLVIEGLLYGPVFKLFKREIVVNNSIGFPVHKRFGEDLQFNFGCLKHCRNIYCVSSAKYHYRIIGENTLSTVHRDDQFANDYEQWTLQYDFYTSRGMMTKTIETFLYRRLWGQTYDGLFLYKKISKPGLRYIRSVLSAGHISDLKKYKELFHCAKWIKWAIVNRQAWIFYFYFEIQRCICR